MEKPKLLAAQDLLKFILTESARAKHARIAVAFARQSGLALLERQIETSLEEGRKWDFLIGLDFSQTEGLVLTKLLEWANTFKNFAFACYSDPTINRAPTFHPKIYIFEAARKASAVVGSSNLTGGGLGSNVEANIVLQGTLNEIEDVGLPGFYAELKYQPNSFVPDEAYIDRYETVRKRVVKASRKVLARPATKREVERLRKEEQELVVKPRDPAKLSRQQRWLYDRLPASKFGTSDIYALAQEFPSVSKTKEASLRRLLQELRDEGILMHLGKGQWKRRM